MVTLNADQIAALMSVRPHVSYRRSADPAAIHRKAQRLAGFNATVRVGARLARRSPLIVR